MTLTTGTDPGNGAASRTAGAPQSRRPPAGAPSTTQRRLARNRARMLLGAFLVAACGLLGAMVVSSASDRQSVVAVARRVPAGQVIERDDLRRAMASVEGGGGIIPASQADRLVGQVALVDLVPGSLLAPGQSGGSRPARPGQAVVGATLKDGQFPIDLQVGSPVGVVILPGHQGTALAVPRPITATVVALGRSADAGPIPVSLSVPPDAATEVAVAGAEGRVALVELAR